MGGDCGPNPLPDASYQLVADGTCRQNGTIAYNVVCNADGSATRNYFGDSSKSPNYTPPQAPEHYPAGVCTASLPQLQGIRVTCLSGGKAELGFWYNKPAANQTVSTIVMKD